MPVLQIHHVTALIRSQLHVPFLNLMNIVAERAGAVHIRVGGNTQETAFMVDSLPDGKILAKDKEDASNPVRICQAVSTGVLTDGGDATDSDARAGHHAWVTVHVGQRLQPRERQMVPRWVASVT